MDSSRSGRNTIRVSRKLRTSSAKNNQPKQKKLIKPAEIHELRFNTQKVLQQNRLLKAQLNRLKDRINTTTKNINKTVSNTRDVQYDHTNENICRQLNDSIIIAQHTIDQLDAEIQEKQNDDRIALVEELETELKVAYGEYMRLYEKTHQGNTSNADLVKRLNAASQRCSKRHAHELDIAIIDTKEANKMLQDKVDAYNKRAEKVKIERVINERQEKGMSHKYALISIDDTKANRTQKYNSIVTSLNEEMDQYNANVDKLIDLIGKKRNTIKEYIRKKMNNELDNEEEEDVEGREEEEEFEEAQEDEGVFEEEEEK